MVNINSLTFFKAWLESVNNKRDHLLNIWRKKDLFTPFIKGDDNSVIDEVASKLNLLCYPRDYYSIDTILYKKEDLLQGLEIGQYWFRDIRVAFEHENDFNKKLREEVSHLLIINCDLKVLVTYPPNDEKEATIKDYLHDIIKGTRHSKMLSDTESFLMIFGYESDFGWLGFVYKEDNWKLIDIS